MKFIRTSLLVLGFMCVILFSVYAGPEQNRDYEFLAGIGLLPDNMAVSSDIDFTRQQMAFVLAKLYNAGEIEPEETKFEDVSAANEFSGYINFVVSCGLMNPSGDNRFEPGQGVAGKELIKSFIDYIDYGEIAKLSGGYSDGYIRQAERLGWLRYVSIEKKVSVSQAVKFIENALTTEYNPVITNSSGVAFLDKKTTCTILASKLGLDTYDATVIGYINNSNVTVRIIKNRYGINSVIYEKNREVSFLTDGSVDFYHYMEADVTIYVNEDGFVVYAVSDKNVTIKYDYIYSVNDNEEEVSYRPDFIRKIELYSGEEYDVAENFKISLNENAVSGPVRLAGRFAKMVIADDSIRYIETWDLKPGGLITALREGAIVYSQKTNEDVYLKDITLYKKKLIYIDGVQESYASIRINSLFDYYVNDRTDTVVIVNSEKSITDTLHAVGDDFVQIGNAQYKCNPAQLYYSKDGRKFYGYKGKIDDIGNNVVTAFVDGKGNVLYMQILPQEGREEFFGVLLGASIGKGYNPDMIKVKLLEGGEDKVYAVSKKIRLDDGLTLDSFYKTAKDYNGNGVYKFKLNSAGEVIHVRKPKQHFNVAEAAVTSLSVFKDNSVPAYVVADRIIFIKDTPIYVLYKSRDELILKEISYSAIRSKTANGAIMRFLSDEDPNELAFILICGDLSQVHAQYGQYFGIVTKKTQVYSEDSDEEMISVTILRYNNEEHHLMDKEAADQFPLNRYMFIGHGYMFAGSDIYPDIRHTPIDLSAGIDDWPIASGGAQLSLRKGIVKSVYSDRIVFDDGSEYGYLYYLALDSCGVYAVNDNATAADRRFRVASVSDIHEGMEIIYVAGTGGNGNVESIFYKDS